MTLHVQDLGRMPYVVAMSVQRQVHQRVLEGVQGPTLLLVEHDPVITVSQRRSAAGHVLMDAQQLVHLGIDVQPTDRGGDVTYHGPGQLVAYPILRLGPLGLNVGRYIRWLEQIILETVAAFGVPVCRQEGLTGVWTPSPTSEGSRAKLCAIGVRVRRNTTMHGFALNVTTNLDHFKAIVPCGLTGCAVTSLQQKLGDKTPTMDQVKEQVIASMRRRLAGLSHTKPN